LGLMIAAAGSLRRVPLMLVVVLGAGCSTSGATRPGADGGPGADAPACQETTGPLSGTKPAGELCQDPRECARGTDELIVCLGRDRQDIAAKIVRCQRLQRARRGDPCVATQRKAGLVVEPVAYFGTVPATFPDLGAFCDESDGLSCDHFMRTCQPLAMLGESCENVNCADATYCVGTCLPKLAAGQPCTSAFDLGGNSWCTDANYCDLVTNICVPRLAEGARCMLDFMCASNRCRADICVKATGC
jgi:hypothetical protein